MIHDNESGWTEAEVSINGRTLSFAEAMALRVAVSTMRISLHGPAMRQGLGDRLADGYDAHLRKVESLLITGKG